MPPGLREKTSPSSVLHRENMQDFAIKHLKNSISRRGQNLLLLHTQGCKKLRRFLTQRGFAVGRCRAGLSEEERRQAQEDFAYDRVQAIVAANAFGMGVLDKCNVRSCIHCQVPRNLESYYQEAGQAGRDGEEMIAFSCSIPRTSALSDPDRTVGAAPELKSTGTSETAGMYRYAHTRKCLRQHSFATRGGSRGILRRLQQLYR